MPTVPVEFAERLHEAFDGRLRARWSTQRNEFQIEQRVARGLVNFPAPDDNDEMIRLKDGYFYVMSIRNGTTMPCPKHCGTDLQVPVHEIRELSCPTCRAKGVEHRVSAGFYPLDDRLIDYLRMIDPMRGASRDLRNKINDHNQKFTDAQRAKVMGQLTDAAADDFDRIAGIPKTAISSVMPGTEGVRGT